MLPDYYFILEIIYPSNQIEIKKNYRRLAKKWHPDINHSVDATEKMKTITEAYYVLSNVRSKQLYDEHYAQVYGNKQKTENKQQTKNRTQDFKQDSKTSAFDTTTDELFDWIDKARAKAKEYVNQTIVTTKGASAQGCKTAGKAFLIGVAFILLIILIGLFARLFK
jgi:DnaJ-class molecular chaperone